MAAGGTPIDMSFAGTIDRHRPSASCPQRAATAGSGRRSALVEEDAADVLSVEQVAVAVVELVERVPAGDQLVQLEGAAAVEAEQPGDVVERGCTPRTTLPLRGADRRPPGRHTP